MIHGDNVIKMDKTVKPKLIQCFENLLWAHSPQNWILKSTYFHDTLFVSMIITKSNKEKIEYDFHSSRTIRRNFTFDTIKSRKLNLSDLAFDCIRDMKKEIQ